MEDQKHENTLIQSSKPSQAKPVQVTRAKSSTSQAPVGREGVQMVLGLERAMSFRKSLRQETCVHANAVT